MGRSGGGGEGVGGAGDRVRLGTKGGRVGEVEWRRLADEATGRLLLGFGHALTIDAAQGITSDEHINALPRGTSGVTAFTTYSAESRSRGATWTIISEAAVYETERYRQALGDITPITRDDLWARVAEDMSRKPYKALGIDLLAAARRDREQAVDAFIASHHALETAQLDNPNFGRDAVKRLRALAVNQTLSRHLAALDRAVAENGELIRDIVREQEADTHLRALQADAVAAKRQIDIAERPTPSNVPSL